MNINYDVVIARLLTWVIQQSRQPYENMIVGVKTITTAVWEQVVFVS